MNVDVVFPSAMEGILWGYVIIEQGSIYPMFSGHNTICVVTALLVSWQYRILETTYFVWMRVLLLKQIIPAGNGKDFDD